MNALPQGWRVENLGLIGAVEFDDHHGHRFTWCDGQWHMSTRTGLGWTNGPAVQIPHASTMAEARKVGTAWIARVFTEVA